MLSLVIWVKVRTFYFKEKQSGKTQTQYTLDIFENKVLLTPTTQCYKNKMAGNYIWFLSIYIIFGFLAGFVRTLFKLLVHGPWGVSLFLISL